MIKKNWIKNLPLILLILAVGLSPSFSAGGIEGGAKIRIIEIRVEDFLLVILGFIWIISFLIPKKNKIEKPPLFLPILLWLTVGLFSVLTNWIFMNIGMARGFFYFLKEVEFFFLYFYVFYHLKNINSAKLLIKIWIFVGLVNIGWVIYNIIKEVRGTYGQEAIVETGGPLPSGGFFLIIFIFLFNILLFYYLKLNNISIFKKAILTVFTVSPALGVLTSGSRDSAVGLAFALFLTVLISFFKERNKFKPFLIFILIIIFITLIYLFLTPKVFGIKRAITRWGEISISAELRNLNPYARPNIWKTQIAESLKRPYFIFFGYGKSAVLFVEETHNQFIRNFIETGIIGSLIFLFLIYLIIKKSFLALRRKDPFVVGISSALLVATLTMLVISIPADAFIVVKIAEPYWFFTAIAMATLFIFERNHQFL